MMATTYSFLLSVAEASYSGNFVPSRRLHNLSIPFVTRTFCAASRAKNGIYPAICGLTAFIDQKSLVCRLVSFFRWSATPGHHPLPTHSLFQCRVQGHLPLVTHSPFQCGVQSVRHETMQLIILLDEPLFTAGLTGAGLTVFVQELQVYRRRTCVYRLEHTCSRCFHLLHFQTYIDSLPLPGSSILGMVVQDTSSLHYLYGPFNYTINFCCLKCVLLLHLDFLPFMLIAPPASNFKATCLIHSSVR